MAAARQEYNPPACAHPGCESLQVLPCGYQERFETARCGSFWCQTHVMMVGEVPCCPTHAPVLAAITTAGKALPTLDDKGAALATFISEDVDSDITDLLKQRFADRPDVTVMSDERVRDTWYRAQLVWWRAWGALTNTGYLARIAIWIPTVSPPTKPEVHIQVDSNVVLKTVPEWVERSLAGEDAQDSDVIAFHNRVIAAVRGGLDMPADFLAQPVPKANGHRHHDPQATVPATAPAAIRLLVVAADRPGADAIVALAGGDPSISIIGSVTDADEAVERAQAAQPDVIALEFGGDAEAGACICERMLDVAPNARTLVILEDGSTKLLWIAHQAGASDVLVWPFSSAALGTAVARVAAGRQPVVAAPPVAAPDSTEALAAAEPPYSPQAGPSAPVEAWMPPPAEEAWTPPPAEEAWQPPPLEVLPQPPSGEITVVFSHKGGVGKTLLAMNLAAAVASRTAGEVGLVDLDLQFGDLAVLLGVPDHTSISHAVKAYPELDPVVIGDLMPLAADGIRLLAAPIKPELADLVKAEHVRAVLAALRANHRHVFVDCGTHLDDCTVEAVQAADRILLVVDLDLSTIKNGRVALDLFVRLNVPSERVFVVLNRADRERSVTADQVERLLGHPVTIHLPYERNAIRAAATRARAAVNVQPDAPFSRQVQELARLIGYA